MEPRQLLKISGKSQFFELMSNTIDMDNMYINFEEYDLKKPKGQRKQGQVQIYVPCIKAYVLSKDIFSGKMSVLAKRAQETAKKSGYKYAKEIYTHMGGVSKTKLAKFGKDRKDGMSLSRQFKITPGSKLPWILSAESGPGEEDVNGLIVPRYGNKPEIIIRVALTDEQFKQFAGTLELACMVWMQEKIFRKE